MLNNGRESEVDEHSTTAVVQLLGVSEVPGVFSPENRRKDRLRCSNR